MSKKVLVTITIEGTLAAMFFTTVQELRSAISQAFNSAVVAELPPGCVGKVKTITIKELA